MTWAAIAAAGLTGVAVFLLVLSAWPVRDRRVHQAPRLVMLPSGETIKDRRAS